MAFAWDNSDNIDPQLLMQQVGTFSFPASDRDENGIESTERPLDQEVDMSMELASGEDNVELYMGHQNMETDHEIDIQMEQQFEPTTPHRPLQAFNPEAQAFYPTPPSSTQVTGNVSFLAPSWHDHNRFAVLSDGDSEASAPRGPYRYVDNAGFLTPNSATISHVEAARHHAISGSPTPRVTYQLSVGQRLYSQVAQSAPTMNMNGVPANVPAVENMHVWAAGASSGHATVGNERQSLAPAGPAPQGRSRTRAASVASSMGQGEFVCEGGPGKACGKRFLTKSKMAHHARCHKSARHFCTLCNAGSYYLKDLKRHMKTHEPRDRHLICNNIGCNYHEKPFARKDHRDRHERSCRHSQA